MRESIERQSHARLQHIDLLAGLPMLCAALLQLGKNLCACTWECVAYAIKKACELRRGKPKTTHTHTRTAWCKPCSGEMGGEDSHEVYDVAEVSPAAPAPGLRCWAIGEAEVSDS